MTVRRRVELCATDPARARSIPVHYEGWSHFSEGRDAIERDARRGARRRRATMFRLLPIGLERSA